MIAANDNNPNRFYVYAWRRPDTGNIFYIGKGRGKRDVEPKSRHNKIFERIVAKLKRNGLEPTVERLHDNLTEEQAKTIERANIKLIGRIDIGTGTLANMTDGGDGTSGWVPSVQTRLAISAGNKGREFSDEHKAKISAANGGKPRNADAVRRSAEARTGRKLTQEHRSACASGIRRMGPRGVSGLKGVSFNKATNKWMMTIRINGVSKSLYGFQTPEAAAVAYDKAAYLAWGEDCYLNFGPPENDNCIDSVSA